MVAGFSLFAWLVWGFADATVSPIRAKPAIVGIAFDLIAPTWRTLALSMLVVWIVLKRDRFPLRWEAWEFGSKMRLLICVAATLLAWVYAFGTYNYFYGEWFIIDRVLTLATLIALYFCPAFATPFAVLIVAFASKLEFPLGGFSWAVTYQGIHIIVAFAAFHLLSTLTRERNSRIFVYFVLCLLVAHYWSSGLAKLLSGWFFSDRIELLLPNAYANGWFASASPDRVEALTRIFADFRWPARAFTLLVECGGVLLFLHRRIAVGILICWFLFHLAVVATTGIFFWQWMIVEATCLYIILKTPLLTRKGFFGVRSAVVGAAIIVTSPFWLRTVDLTWFDSPATYYYRFEGISEAGERFQLPPAYFKPYEYQFSVGAFHYLAPDPLFSVTWGAASKASVSQLFQANSVHSLLALRRQMGVDQYDAERKETLSEFLQTFVAERNMRLDNSNDLGPLQAPRLVLNSAKGRTYDGRAKIARVEVTQVLSYFDGARYHVVETVPLLSLDIPE